LPYIDFTEVKCVLRKQLEQVEFDVVNHRLKSVPAANDS
jgi:hypothetical protein